MMRAATLSVVMMTCLGPVVAVAQEPPGPPEPPRLLGRPEPGIPEPGILLTNFASDRDSIAVLDPTAPPESGPTPMNIDVDLDGEFCSPNGNFTRFRYISPGGTSGFGITSLEWGYDSSATWWECWCQEGSTRLRADLGFGIHWWSGPRSQNEVTVLSRGYSYAAGSESNGTQPPPLDDDVIYMPAIYGYSAGTHLPPRVYDLYLDLLWQEHWSDQFMTDVLVSPGLFTDFRTTPPQSFRLRGHAIGLYAVAPDLQLVGGVDFINRLKVKALPVAGVLWRPSDDTRLHLVFPAPKISHRVGIRGDKEYWLFLSGEYGGGVWTYKTEHEEWYYSWYDYYGLGHPAAMPYYYGTTESHDRVEYSDLRLIAGIELFDRGEAYPCAVLEFGYVFDRHIRWQKAGVEFEPKDTFMVGVRFTH